MPPQKRASGSSSSGQASLLKRPRVARTNQTWHRSGTYLMRKSWLTEEDIRRVVREELERAIPLSAQNCSSCNWNALGEVMNAVQKLTEKVELANIHSPHLGRVNIRSMGINDVRNLRLQFQTKLPNPIYTGRKLRGVGGARVSVVLIDANTGDVVTSGPESSLKLDIVALEGGFDKDDADNWTHEDFEKYVVERRKQKGLLLTGDLEMTLNGGVGELGELLFTDNSSWNESKRFRIGLRVASSYCGNMRIREAKTNAFRVMEHRGELSKKHDIPAFGDEIWMLKMIAKRGTYHNKLSKAGIRTVGDFLLQLFLNPVKLKEILGMSSNPKKWDTLENHAKSCETNWKLYLYYTDDMGKDGAVFNTDRQLIGIIKDRAYCATDLLPDDEKEQVDTIVKMALDNWNDVREFNGETFCDSMQKNSSTSFPRNCAAPVALQAFPANAGSTAGGHIDVAASALPVQSQNTNFGNAMGYSIDEFLAEQPISGDSLNILISPGDNNITTGKLPTQPHDMNVPMHSQTDYIVNGHVLPSEPTCASVFFQSGTTHPLPEGNHAMEVFQSPDSDDSTAQLLACIQYSSDEDTFLQTSQNTGASWMKIYGALKLFCLIKKRRVRVLQ